MKGNGFAFRALLSCALFVSAISPTFGQHRSVVQDATLTLRLFPERWQESGLRLETTDASPQVLLGEVDFLISDALPVALLEKDGWKEFDNPQLRIVPGIRFIFGNAQVEVSDLVWMNEVGADGAASVRSQVGFTNKPVLELRGYRVGGVGGTIAASQSITISTALAEKLGKPELAGVSLGMARLNGIVGDIRAGGGKEEIVHDVPNTVIDTVTPDGGVAAPGPDMTFCQLYGLQQYGRLGDIVGLALATTSWNIGARDLIWMANPDNRHPMIIWNVFRLKNDRFEQIGMSHVKHGFFALGDTQCGGPACTYEPGHGTGDWLGQNCTDTYSSGLNAGQSGLGPRYEINGWTGGYTFAGSHLAGGGSHTAITHRCQVRDADLVAAQNPGATYFAEGQYTTIDDVNPVNSVAWKPITVSGAAGGTWTFGMSGSGTLPNTGPAINAWTGATQTTLAQQVPVVRFSSPDGRCILASKPTDLGGGQWHYEYALFNLDMHRKGRSFFVPLPPGVTATNIGFHAVEHHNEPYTNSPWTTVVDSSGITWSTTYNPLQPGNPPPTVPDNPLRWGMMFNFRFDADAPPADVTVTVGLYEPGTPTSISGITPGPFLANPAPNPQADPTGMQKSRFISTVIPPAATAAGQPTALRVWLTSLHHVVPPDTGGAAADFSAYEGTARWVGPPTQYTESTSNPTTFYAATLQCSPFYQDWNSVGLLHITGPEIVPSSVYSLQNVAVTCMGNEANCTDVSALLEVATTRWADLVTPFNPPSDTTQPDIGDISGLVDKFRSVSGAPIKAQALLAGNMPDLLGDVDFSQISAAVGAFRGEPYPNSGPSPCP